jgi:hypothetical protein
MPISRMLVANLVQPWTCGHNVRISHTWLLPSIGSMMIGKFRRELWVSSLWKAAILVRNYERPSLN